MGDTVDDDDDLTFGQFRAILRDRPLLRVYRGPL
jgi:hypothetical protein